MQMISGAMAAVTLHELGHYLAARCFGKRLKFRFGWGWLWKIPVPRFTWSMPYMEKRKQRVVALAGFGTEFAFVPIFYALFPAWAPWYAAAALLHLGLYPFYAGASSDFKWL